MPRDHHQGSPGIARKPLDELVESRRERVVRPAVGQLTTGVLPLDGETSTGVLVAAGRRDSDAEEPVRSVHQLSKVGECALTRSCVRTVRTCAHTLFRLPSLPTGTASSSGRNPGEPATVPPVRATALGGAPPRRAPPGAGCRLNAFEGRRVKNDQRDSPGARRSAAGGDAARTAVREDQPRRLGRRVLRALAGAASASRQEPGTVYQVYRARRRARERPWRRRSRPEPGWTGSSRLGSRPRRCGSSSRVRWHSSPTPSTSGTQPSSPWAPTAGCDAASSAASVAIGWICCTGSCSSSNSWDEATTAGGRCSHRRCGQCPLDRPADGRCRRPRRALAAAVGSRREGFVFTAPDGHRHLDPDNVRRRIWLPAVARPVSLPCGSTICDTRRLRWRSPPAPT